MIPYNLRKNCLLKHVTEGNIQGGIEVAERRGRSCKHLLDEIKENKGHGKLKEEALDRICGELAFEEAMALS
jgi:hypothetical protein